MDKRILVALLLAFASGSALAQTASNGGSGSGSANNEEESAPAPKRPQAPTSAPTESRKGTPRSETRTPPRWHSFLPGMFR